MSHASSFWCVSLSIDMAVISPPARISDDETSALVQSVPRRQMTDVATMLVQGSSSYNHWQSGRGSISLTILGTSCNPDIIELQHMLAILHWHCPSMCSFGS